MKKFVSIFLSISLILLVACQNEQADIYSAHMTAVEEKPQDSNVEENESTGDGLSGTLLLSALDAPGDYSNWSSLADGFMELHPNVEVIAVNENGMGFDPTASREENLIKIEKYKTDLNISLVSGNAPDIIFNESYILSDILPSGMLMDLNEFIENDETFIEEDFYMNVIKSTEMGGALTAIPTGFYSNAVRFNTNMLDAAGISLDGVETVDYKLILENYNKVVDSGEVPSLKSIERYAAYSQHLYVTDEICASIDFENFTSNFDTENFRNCLIQMKEYIDSMGTVVEEEYDELYRVFDKDNHLVESTYTFLYQDIEKTMMEYANASEPYPFVTSTGKHIVSLGALMAIPQTAKNPELAWEFIKYCTYESEKVATFYDWEKVGRWDGDRFEGRIPVNRGNFEKYVKLTLNGYPEYMEENLIKFIDEATSLEIQQSFMFQTLIDDIWENIVSEYYNGLLTIDECISAISERTDIYFAEIS